MDYVKELLPKIKSYNDTRKFLEKETRDNLRKVIKVRIMENGYTNDDGNVHHSIPTHLAAEVTPVGHDKHCFIHEVYYNPNNQRVYVIGSYEILLENTDVNVPLDDIGIDGQIAILESMLA